MLKSTVAQMSVVNPFFSDVRKIAVIKKAMDEIENRKLGYDDYSKRTGLIWSDVLVKTVHPAEIVEEYATKKVTLVSGQLQGHQPQSISQYPELKTIVSHDILPKMFETVRIWTSLPEAVYAQLFFQRCSTSEPMAWHQDPGEDFDPQANYSLVLMLSEQNDSQHGWAGGEFKIRSGLPESRYDETDVMTIIPRYNQAIIFNNQINTHATTEVINAMKNSKRDIIVIPIHLTKMSVAKE